MTIPKTHPRYHSLKTRDKIVSGVSRGIASIHGLIAHGRGEAFDYIIEEKTNKFALHSVHAAAAMLLRAENPVISVNGNAAALCAKELATLGNVLGAPLEINIFHPSKIREKHIKTYLEKNGAKKVLLPDKKTKIKFLDSNRKYVNADGIFAADVVFVPLEDGDRTQALIKNGKKVITVDINPFSRTARTATITIIDNILRALPALIATVQTYKKAKTKKQLSAILKQYHNKKILAKSIQHINLRLKKLANKNS